MPLAVEIGAGVIGVSGTVFRILNLLGIAPHGPRTVDGDAGLWCLHNNYRGCVGLLSDGEPVPAAIIERQDVGPCNVPMYNFDICHDQIANQAANIWSSIPAPGVAQFDNVPPACMNLAVVLSGSCTGEGTNPVPCGSACIQYTGLSDEQFAALSMALHG
ncbi:Uncharacterized protein SAPIO_CDS4272 [Scedosporium apiospermum]|uniref:Uncharacterized protein n=1 Tax=Pseudallescheria apiosperma TaxID=563466 RepID=A0A084G8K1_PSEDA|nr:Uncharacterized protein SAPIO_CDS4272 [Scedosporium apiospermum]KEZ43663.1 Uncharacterized protein SAPIO_CDS4272 [Scedosporium apiospermum]